MKYLALIITLLVFCQLNAQIKPNPVLVTKDSTVKDSVRFAKGLFSKKEKAQAKPLTANDYKSISLARDTISLDTTLSIKKDYKYNYLRRDDFELLPFSNVGQPYNALGKNFDSNSVYPELGAIAKNQKYFKAEDILYYNVPTPLTELTFKTTFEQGQFLDAMLALNTSERFNVSIAFNGFRSLGKYNFNQSEAAIFRTTFNYKTKNNSYWARGHYASQELETEENGGITDRTQFESGDDTGNIDFSNRSLIDVAFNSLDNNLADNRILGKRYFLDHQFNIVKPKKDSIKNSATLLSIGHQYSYESKLYQFTQDSESEVFGNAFVNVIDDTARLRTTFNQVSANFSNKTLGALSGNLSLYNYDYSFNSILIREGETIQNQLEGNEVSAGADYKNNIGPLQISGKVRFNVSGDLAGNLFDAGALYKLNANNTLTAAIHSSSKAPSFNFLLYQSDYENFNWQNDDFQRQQTQSISFGFNSKLLGNLSAKYSAIDNYTYFTTTDDITQEDIADGNQNAFVRAFQETETVNYLKIKYEKEFKWRKWSLNNTFLYQEVDQNNQVLNVPEFVTRNTLYFSSDVFNKAMYIQTGVNFKYFTAYNLDAYHPLLGEFYTQNNEEFGAFPLLDLFINAKVRQTRIFLKAEHLNSILTNQNDFYAAPNYPYRDFVLRFGLVWNFFS